MTGNLDRDLSSEDEMSRFRVWIEGEVKGAGDEGDSRAVRVGGG